MGAMLSAYQSTKIGKFMLMLIAYLGYLRMKEDTQLGMEDPVTVL